MNKIIYLLLFCFTSCGNKIEKIEVLYYKGNIDFSVQKSKADLLEKNNYYNLKTDTIFVDNIEFNEYVLFINSNKNTNQDNFDARILLRHNNEVWCGDNGFVESKLNEKMKYVLYRLKNKVYYYNYFSKEDLIDMPEIKKYGVPIGYKEINYNDVNEYINSKPYKKIILLVK